MKGSIVNKKEFIDKDTGEVFDSWVVDKFSSSKKQFVKIFLIDFLSVLGIFESKQVEVFIHIVENTNLSTNLFIGSFRDIANNSNVSLSTVTTIMKKLQENQFITKVKNNVYAVNPKILMKGRANKQHILINYHEELKDKNNAK